MSVTTVLGEIAAEDLGVTLSHEHVLIDLFRVYQPHRDMYLHDENLATQELARFAAMRGGTVVDLTTPDLGRDPAALVRISKATGLNIVMGSGRYRAPFYEDDLARKSTATLTDEFVNDVTTGQDGIKPGVIGEIGTDYDYISPIEERVHRAAARASVLTGLPVITHSLGSNVGLAQLALLREEGVAESRIAIGHADTWPDPDYHRQLLEGGAFLLFDTLRGRVPYETARTIELIKNVVSLGFAHRLLLSHDVCGTAHYKAYGGEGFTFVPGSFLTQLEESGVPVEVGRNALTANPAAFFNHE